MFSRKGAYVDHNILKHLNIEKQNALLATEHAAENEQNQTLGSLLLHLPEKKKALIDPLLDHSQPPPTFDEKRKGREKMFNFMEESAIEETRLVTSHLNIILYAAFNQIPTVTTGTGSRTS